MSAAEEAFADAIVAAIGTRTPSLLSSGAVAEEAALRWASRGIGTIEPGRASAVLLIDGDEPAEVPNSVVAAVRSRGNDPTTRLRSLEEIGDLVALRLEAPTHPSPEAGP